MDDNFEVFLNGVSIGFLDLGKNDLVGSVFIASTNRRLQVTEPDFVCPMSKMKVYYFDSNIVKYGKNTIFLKNVRANGNGNLGTISIRNYKIVGDNLIKPCRIADLDYSGNDRESFTKSFYLTECCEK